MPPVDATGPAGFGRESLKIGPFPNCEGSSMEVSIARELLPSLKSPLAPTRREAQHFLLRNCLTPTPGRVTGNKAGK